MLWHRLNSKCNWNDFEIFANTILFGNTAMNDDKSLFAIASIVYRGLVRGIKICGVVLVYFLVTKFPEDEARGKCFATKHSEKSASIRESNHGSDVCKEHYA